MCVSKTLVVDILTTGKLLSYCKIVTDSNSAACFLGKKSTLPYFNLILAMGKCEPVIPPTELKRNASSTAKPKSSKQPILWYNVFKFSVMHLVGLCGAYVIFLCNWKTTAFNIVYGMVGHLGITAGAHRLWSHRSFKASLPLRIFLAACNSVALQNSIYQWARDHRAHHRHSETDADPHNAKRGFFFSHMGWLLMKKHPDVLERGSKIDVSDLMADPVVAFQKKYYRWTTLVMCYVIPISICCWSWNESIIYAYFVTSLRYVISLNVTFLVNSAAHLWGNKPYDVNINPAQNLGVTLLTMGEGFHNYHHVFPHDYRTSEFGIRFNLTTAFIDLMSLLGLASNLKKVSKETVLARRSRTGDLMSAASG